MKPREVFSVVVFVGFGIVCFFVVLFNLLFFGRTCCSLGPWTQGIGISSQVG